ncbi:MAG: amylo-alpha-1,6-glucosidase [Acidimicrobiales bacterium]
MSSGWGGWGSGPQLGSLGEITIVEGSSFCISERTGDISAGGSHGLFCRDNRFLSRWKLEVDGRSAQPLTVERTAPFAASFTARQPPHEGLADSTLLVVRRRYVGNGMREDITIGNLGSEATTLRVTLSVDADFADLFAVKEGRAHDGDGVERSVKQGCLELSLSEGGEGRAVTILATGEPIVGPEGLTWLPVVPVRSEWSVVVLAVPSVDGERLPIAYELDQPVDKTHPVAALAAWRAATPEVETPDEPLTSLLAASAENLGSLRIFDPSYPEQAVVAAGAPWFMTLFGRDALLTSWMLLPLDSSLALGTLKTLARLQGTSENPRTEEEPGRILHEVRSGLDAEATLGQRNIYYGSVDATPLFVMLLGELRRWGLPRSVVEPLLGAADAALDWIESYGDKDGDGFVEYQRATDKGLLNQGWKDSIDAISYASGKQANPPIALAEVQGYVYGAYLARSHFAREAGDIELARHWAGKAGALKRHFNEKFWLSDRGYFALALDADKEPVDSLASNMGHCLWTGIVDEDKATMVAGALMSKEMFSGFGIRTLATSMGAYNPMSYHNGSVWPHDCAIAAAGLMRYGFQDAARQIAVGVFDAAERLGGRIPELFCGFDRAEFEDPVPYPTAGMPQAWAAATPLFLLRTLLRFDPWIPFGRCWCDPSVPERYLPLEVAGIHLAGADISVTVNDDGWSILGLPAGIELMRSPRKPLTAAVPSSLTDQSKDLLTDLEVPS